MKTIFMMLGLIFSVSAYAGPEEFDSHLLVNVHSISPCASWRYHRGSAGEPSGYICSFRPFRIQVPDASLVGREIRRLEDRIRELEQKVDNLTRDTQ